MADDEYRKTVEMLYSVAPSFQKVGAAGYHPGLGTMLRFTGSLGNPQNLFKSVHVAGTNGKGSVSHMLASALAVSLPGRTIGLYTSPHLLDFRERVRIITSDDGFTCSYEDVEKDFVIGFVKETADFVKAEHPSFFEITTAMAFKYFALRNVEYAVIETGLGGRLDSTNVIRPRLSIITSIGLDHKDILGDTIGQIAAEKGGIVKPGVPVVLGKLPEEASDVIAGIASRAGSTAIYSDTDAAGGSFDDVPLSEMDLKGFPQRVNLRTVSAALSVLGKEVPVDIRKCRTAVCHAARFTGLRGRWEKLMDAPLAICDIGHNPQAVSIAVEQMRTAAAGRRKILIIGMAADKDVRTVTGMLPEDAFYIFTKASGPRAIAPGKLAAMALEGHHGSLAGYAVTETVAEAVERCMQAASPDDFIFIGGSSYVVAEAIGIFDSLYRQRPQCP